MCHAMMVRSGIPNTSGGASAENDLLKLNISIKPLADAFANVPAKVPAKVLVDLL